MRRSIGLPRVFALFSLPQFEIVEPLQEQQIRDLLHHLERVGDPTGPKGVPDLVHFAA
jgi:hypothetical protein